MDDSKKTYQYFFKLLFMVFRRNAVERACMYKPELIRIELVYSLYMDSN